jgi:flagellar biosynthetic protein FlhB
MPVSADFTAAGVLLAAWGVQMLVGGRLTGAAVAMVTRQLAVAARADLTPDSALVLLLGAATSAAGLAWPLVAGAAAAGLATHLLQTRLAVAPEALAFRWGRLNPLPGLARLVGGHGLVELVKSAVKITVAGAVAFFAVRAHWPVLLFAGDEGPEAAPATLGRVVAAVWWRVGAAYLLLAGVDYAYQWWRHERSLRMTRQELREESKETEGDPLLRGRLRALHRQMAARRMMAEAARADVVLSNPTHVAVALRYDSQRMKAPRVVAKGERLVALRIIDVARRHGVPVVQNPPLVRTLFRTVAVGREIPRNLYRAVAEILVHVYSLKARGR